MDARPYDTENIINTRSRIRLSSFIALLCVFAYISIQESFTGAHVSYLHLFHVFLQPIVLFVSLLDISTLPSFLSTTHFAMLVVDGSVLALSYISISRCFNEKTATCYERVYEKGVWIVLAGILCTVDIVIAIQMQLLHSQMEEKNVHQKAEEEKLKLGAKVPSWNTILVYKNKIRALNLFLIPLDVAYVICMYSMVDNVPLYFLSAAHAIIDPLLVYIDLGTERTQYDYFRVAYGLLFGLNVLLIIIQLQIHIDHVSEMLALLISIVYIVTDLNQIVYMSEIIQTIVKYKQYKRSL